MIQKAIINVLSRRMPLDLSGFTDYSAHRTLFISCATETKDFNLELFLPLKGEQEFDKLITFLMKRRDLIGLSFLPRTYPLYFMKHKENFPEKVKEHLVFLGECLDERIAMNTLNLLTPEELKSNIGVYSNRVMPTNIPQKLGILFFPPNELKEGEALGTDGQFFYIQGPNGRRTVKVEEGKVIKIDGGVV